MSLKLSSPTKVSLRSWTLDDLMFTLRVRNHPKLMQYFRQDEPINLEDQREFITQDVSAYGSYNGNVIEADGEPVGLCGVKSTGEFTIAMLPEHQHRGISTWAMRQLINTEQNIWSEVFIHNPALNWFIGKLGFHIVGIKERAYYKKGIGMIDVVSIQHE